MPELCRFLGIVIGMFYREHGDPHFHAVYGNTKSPWRLKGNDSRGFPPRALKLVLEWRDLHRAELFENWQLAKQGQPLKRISPLE